MPRFNVTYDIVTPESAEHGDAAERGFVSKNVTLSEAIDDVRSTRTCAVGGIECIEPNASGDDFDWITVINGMEFETGAVESRSIHLPNSITPSSRKRILRLIQT
jgi:hypothetical protein